MGKNRVRWGQWSAWLWHEDYGTYYRVREDDKGHYDYEYNENPGTPRTPDPDTNQYGVSRITEHLDQTNLETNYTTDPDPKRKGDRDDDRTGNHKKDGKRDRKGKGKATATSDLPESYREGGAAMKDTYGQPYTYPSEQYYPTEASGAAHAQAAYGGYDGTMPSGYQDTDPPTVSPGTYAPLDEAGGYGGQQNYHANLYQPQLDEVDEAAGQQLDSRYAVRRSNEFVPGKILKVYWSEPKGGKATTISQGREVYQLGELVYSGFRRLIVIKNDQGHSLCVPILTYESRGCSKPGVKPRKHGMIYDERRRMPKLLHGEPELGFSPVRARMSEDTETLAKESRVNYSKVVTIEHNIPILFVGDVHPDDIRIVRRAHEKCWKR